MGKQQNFEFGSTSGFQRLTRFTTPMLFARFRSMTTPMLLLFTLPFVSVPLARAQAAATTATLTLSSSSVAANTAVALTASVQAGGVPVSPGLVTFQDGKTVLGSAQIASSTHTASMKVILGLGTHQITANFAGTKTDAKSSSSAQTLTVTGPAATTTTIGSSGNTGDYTLTGTVTSNGPLVPTGTVSFIDQTNSNPLGSAPLGGRNREPNLSTTEDVRNGKHSLYCGSRGFQRRWHSGSGGRE